ncbi:putative kinesin [Trypanosoma grayi]|uniref:putative kinesin n=1 Tax=Trypanosoma grayi TaxID=71804 RepID=UPI0004F4069E|nr:putative kinesin [Trypanosoma grayi]KEG08312.1 putative kinesin [Trypanosoma grayi]
MVRRSSTDCSPRTQLTSRCIVAEDDDENNNNNTNELGIVVAVRIRPFIRQEQEGFLRRKAGNDVDAQEQEHREDPIVDVETDGKTIVLLDPVNRSVSRGTFTFEHIFSPLAPSVEVDIFSSSSDDLGLREPEPKRQKKLRRNPNQKQPRSGKQNEFVEEKDSPKGSAPAAAARNEIEIANLDEDARKAELEQQGLFEALGVPVVEWSMRGFNACIFAYGQTGSGKTYTMMGSEEHEGIIPRLCRLFFSRISEQADTEQQRRQQRQQMKMQLQQQQQREPSDEPSPLSPYGLSACSKSDIGSGSTPSPPTLSPASSAPTTPNARLTKVTISFMEIYNERVRDLLKPERDRRSPLHYNSRFDADPADAYEALKVRQHPLHGPFVEGLTTVSVNSCEECWEYIKQGNAVRAQASNSINENSSRSHAIFQMIVTQTVSIGGRVRGREVTTHRISKVNLVDLAGSERNSSMGPREKKFVEANAINLSLSVLRRVINALVNHSKVVPYRESLLTYVLSDNFGGNSRTVMCATISPHVSKFAETESTLRYASLARGIVNRVKINEHPFAKVIRELKERMRGLQEELRSQPTNERIIVLETTMEENARALTELRQREEELMTVVRESKLREMALLEDLHKKQEKEHKWKKEAKRQRHEKEKLITALKDLAQQKPELVAEGVIKVPVSLDEKDKSLTSSTSIPSVLQSQPRDTAPEQQQQQRDPPKMPKLRETPSADPTDAASLPQPPSEWRSPPLPSPTWGSGGGKRPPRAAECVSARPVPTSQCTAPSLIRLARGGVSVQPLSLQGLRSAREGEHQHMMPRSLQTPTHSPRDALRQLKYGLEKGEEKRVDAPSNGTPSPQLCSDVKDGAVRRKSLSPLTPPVGSDGLLQPKPILTRQKSQGSGIHLRNGAVEKNSNRGGQWAPLPLDVVKGQQLVPLKRRGEKKKSVHQ